MTTKQEIMQDTINLHSELEKYLLSIEMRMKYCPAVMTAVLNMFLHDMTRALSKIERLAVRDIIEETYLQLALNIGSVQMKDDSNVKTTKTEEKD